VIIAFDSDVLIYTAVADNPQGPQILRAIYDASVTAIGSVLLRPETLIKPTRTDPLGDEAENLRKLLETLRLIPSDDTIGRLAVNLGAKYGLKAPDAIHLATAINSDAEVFLTNNRKDFPKTITEIDIAYPEDLADLLPAEPANDGQPQDPERTDGEAR
jgi:predicted nucleic acid-binding protein